MSSVNDARNDLTGGVIVQAAPTATYENANNSSYVSYKTRFISKPRDFINRYIFKWADRTGFTTPSTSAYKYTRRRYTLTVNKGTGVSSVTGGGTYKYGQSYSTSGVAASDYTITGKPSGTMPNSNHSVTVTADWNYRRVTFNYNGGSGSESTRDVLKGQAVGSLPSASRSNYSFDGWYTSSSGGSSVNSSTVVNSNITYYAHWSYNPTPNCSLAILDSEKKTTSVDVYRADGVKYATYSSYSGNYLNISCFAGGKVVFHHDSRYRWEYDPLDGNDVVLGTGDAAHFYVPSSASGSAELKMAYFNKGDGQKHSFHFADGSHTKGWVKSSSCYPSFGS